jgi:hypothetical protein
VHRSKGYTLPSREHARRSQHSPLENRLASMLRGRNAYFVVSCTGYGHELYVSTRPGNFTNAGNAPCIYRSRSHYIAINLSRLFYKPCCPSLWYILAVLQNKCALQFLCAGDQQTLMTHYLTWTRSIITSLILLSIMSLYTYCRYTAECCG